MNDKKVVERALDVFWMLLGVAICVQSFRYRLWNPDGPGSGFIPFLCGVLIAGAGFLLFMGERSKGVEQEERLSFWETSSAMKKVLFLLGSLCVMAFLMPRLGFFFTSVVATILMIRIIEAKKWPTVVLVSVSTCSLLYLVFHYVLRIRLPRGFIGF